MTDTEVTAIESVSGPPDRTAVSQSFDWFSEGESKMVEANGIQVVVRYVARKGRRARIAITAPAGAVFRDSKNC
jgi:hypothetical protein